MDIDYSQMNPIKFVYMFMRLSPFILVSFFLISSILNQDLKGIIYLVGVFIACFITFMVGNMMNMPINIKKPEMCHIITIGYKELSKLPMGQTIFGFTYSYLLYVIFKFNLLYTNMPMFIFFTTLIICDLYWNVMNSCFTIFHLSISLFIGVFIGIIWAIFVDSMKSKKLQYYVGVNKNICNKPVGQQFKCKNKTL